MPIFAGQRRVLGVVVASQLASACSGGRPAETSDALVITGVTIVDVLARDEGSALQGDQTVVIRGRHLQQIGPSGSVRIPRGARVIEAKGKYVLPGLWDAHVHISVQDDGIPGVFVANGVTTARDLGYRIPREIREGRIIGPRLFASGPVIESATWMDAVLREIAADTSLGFLKAVFEDYPRYRLASPSEGQAAVDSLSRLGADLIKFRFLGGDEARAVGAAARSRGIPLIGHAPAGISIGEAAEAGMRSIEHAETITPRLGDANEAVRRAEFERVARAGCAITPTLMMNVGFRLSSDSMAAAVVADSANRIDGRRKYLPRSFIAAWKIALRDKLDARSTDWVASHRRQLEDMRLAHAAGVRLLVGADAGDLLVYPGFSVHEELRLFVDDLGLSPLEALRSATVYPAESMGVADSMGTVRRGNIADLVVLDASPLADIRNSERIHAVILAGRFFGRGELDALLSRAEHLARASWERPN